ncbi:MAG: hypothetical protein WC568_03795 [Candidatus Methanoperedens sp.]
MNVIICEGKNDACFLNEIMKERFNLRMHTIYYHELEKLQEMLGTNCYNFVKTKYPLIIYGDGGKANIIIALRRIVVETLGKNNDELYIILIRDDDGAPYEVLNTNLCIELQSLLRDRSKFIVHIPNIECNDDFFILTHPRSRGILKIKLKTVPSNLEKQIAKKTMEFKGLTDSKILEQLDNDPHKALELLANKYYSGDENRLIRESSILLKDETWVNEINRLVN